MIETIITLFTGLTKNKEFISLFRGKEAKLQAFQLALIKEMQSVNIHQIELNKVEAQHTNVFISGWRPFIGWVCGSALAYQFILRSILHYLQT